MDGYEDNDNGDIEETMHDVMQGKHKKFTLRNAIDAFQQETQEGPTAICSCCHELWWPSSMRRCSEKMRTLPKSWTCTFLPDGSNDATWQFCTTCYTDLEIRRFPVVLQRPACFEGLREIEWICIALHNPYAQYVHDPGGKPTQLHGGIVNVPVDHDQVMVALPRPISELDMVNISINRMMKYKGAVWKGVVRIGKVLECLDYLKNTPLYQEAGIKVEETALDELNGGDHKRFR
ncbi:hypothetical protein Vretifemale_14551 [Volvox reticuliferus]|nr:hypothetical protein Vretifemale_14551 [Volvox reticuliferus]